MGERAAHSICIFLQEEQKPLPISSMPQSCISIHLTLLHPLQKSEAMIGTLLPCRYLRTRRGVSHRPQWPVPERLTFSQGFEVGAPGAEAGREAGDLVVPQIPARRDARPFSTANGGRVAVTQAQPLDANPTATFSQTFCQLTAS